MKVYLASWYASRPEMAKRAEELRAVGIEVTSRWLIEKVKATSQIKDVSEEYLQETGAIDVQDVLSANVTVLQVPSEDDLKTVPIPISSWARGGRHFEAGFQYATMLFHAFLPQEIFARGPRELILVGHRENVFHYLDGVQHFRVDGLLLPEIKCFDTWELAKQYLISSDKDQHAKAAGWQS